MNASTRLMTAHDVAEAVNKAISERSIEGLARVYSEDFKIWHNFDNKTQDRAENLAFLTQIFASFTSLGYVDIRRELTESGYVQQHVLVGIVNDGRKLEMPCCHISQVHDGKLRRVDEYFDPAPLYVLTAPAVA